MKISIELLNIIVCPISGEKLEYDQENCLLISRSAGLAYPVVNGIPLLLESETVKLKEEA